MMNTITLSKEKIYVGNLILVNANYPLRATEEKDMVTAFTAFPCVHMKQEAANVLQMIFEKILAGNSIVPVSGYRNVKEQTAIYNSSLKDNGESFTKKYVAMPNHSEHQTGLAIDLALNKGNIDFICPDFPYEGICEEFRNVAPHYGFVERYPKDKEKITGIAHEPWHFRYVGYPHSKIIAEKGFTLEEYIDFIKQFPSDGNHLETKIDEKCIEVYYVAANETEATTITLPKKSVYQVSGNNIDGFIVTLWRNSNE